VAGDAADRDSHRNLRFAAGLSDEPEAWAWGFSVLPIHVYTG
jgi:hypothetical protein